MFNRAPLRLFSYTSLKPRATSLPSRTCLPVRSISTNPKNSKIEIDAAEAYPTRMKYQQVIQQTLEVRKIL